MPRARRAALLRLLPTVLLIALATPAQEPAGGMVRISEEDPAAAWLPAGTVAHVMISGRACLDGYRELALTRVFTDPAMAEFLRPVTQIVFPFVRVWAEQVCEGSGVSRDELQALAASRLTVSFVGLERQEAEAEGRADLRMGFVATLHFDRQGDTVPRLLDYAEITLEEIGFGTVHRHEVGGVPVREFRLRDPSEDRSVWYVVRDGVLVVATSRTTLSDVLGRMGGGDGGLAASPPFAQVTRQVLRPRSAFFAYLDVAALLDIVSVGIDENVRAVLVGTGLDAFDSLGYGCDLDGRGLRDRIYGHASKKRGLIASFQAPQGDIRSHHLVPADCGLYLSGAYNLVGTWDWVNRFYERTAPFEAAEMRRGVKAFEGRLGFSVRDDLLAGLGPEYAVIASFPRSAVIPDLGLLIQVRDRQKVEGILQDLVSGFGDEVRTGRLTWKGHSIGWVDLEQAMGGMPGLKPTWTFVDDFLLVTPWPQAVKRFLASRAAGTPRLAERADFKALLAHLRKDNPKAGRAGLSYVDFQGVVGFLLDNGIPALQSTTEVSPSFPLDFSRFPETERVTRHLFGAIGASHWEESGGYSEFYSPTGLVLPYFVLAGTALVWLQGVPLDGLEMGSGDIQFVEEEGPAPGKGQAPAPEGGGPASRPATGSRVEDG